MKTNKCISASLNENERTCLGCKIYIHSCFTPHEATFPKNCNKLITTDKRKLAVLRLGKHAPSTQNVRGLCSRITQYSVGKVSVHYNNCEG